MHVSFCHVPVIRGDDRTWKLKSDDDERCWNQFSNTCMLQQTDASSKPFGDMTLNMKNDPDSKGA